jgi:hypothetical protein
MQWRYFTSTMRRGGRRGRGKVESLGATVAGPAAAFDQPRLDRRRKIGLGRSFKDSRSHSC